MKLVEWLYEDYLIDCIGDVMKVYITLSENRCSEHGGTIDEMFCRVTSTMQKAKDCCQEVEWEDDDEDLAVSKWVEQGENYWVRVVIFEEEVL